jgi:hypothetical protein
MRDKTECFRFLDLPAELRLMVYEYLPNRTKRAKFVKIEDGVVMSTFTLITTSIPPAAILGICGLINREAKAILEVTAKRYLEAKGLDGPAPRIEGDSLALKAMCIGYSPLIHIASCSASPSQRGCHHYQTWTPRFEQALGNWLAEQGYKLATGSLEQGIQSLVRFARHAVQILLYRKTIDNMDMFRQQDASQIPTCNSGFQFILRVQPGSSIA